MDYLVMSELWSHWDQICPGFANSVDPDQLASEEANWSEFALFVINYVNFIGLAKSGYEINIFLISHWCTSNEYHNMFLWRNKKNMNTFGLKKASVMEYISTTWIK